MVTPINRGRTQEGGRLAVHKNDFNAHISGDGFRQGASTVDINAIEGVVGGNVQEALESLNNLITSAGSGFISIGLADGYAQGSYTVGSEGYDSLRDAFNAAVADPRLQNGGVILLLAGTYKTSATITVPAGITLLGEMGGSIVIGEMPDTPMFQIEGTSNRVGIGGNNGSGDLSMDSGGKPEGVKFVNLMLSDNLDGYAAFGAPSMTSVPMIRCSINSHFTCEHVRFVGRMAAGSPPRDATYAAIGYSAGSSSGTHLHLYKCFFDGISTPILFTAAGGDVDSVIIDHCRARVIGADDDAADGGSENSLINMTACNAQITNNYVHPGPHTNIEFMIVVTASYGDNSRLIISGNSGIGAISDPNYGGLIGGSTSGSTSGLPTMCHGNNWGRQTGEWYVVAGLDYLGSGALDSILNNFALGGIIYIYTSQTVTNSGSSSLNIIGIGKQRIYLDVSSGTDTFTGNTRFTIGSAQNIHFICDTTLTASYHTVLAIKEWSSIYPDVVIDRCVFENCALVVNEVTSGNLNTVSVTNCQFYQNGDYACNTSILLPAARVTKLDNCYFYLNGGGYVGGIGDASSYNSTMTNSLVTVSNCIMNLGNGVIDTSADLSMTHFFWINESTANVVISNSKIICNDNFYYSKTIGVSMSKFVYIKARDIFITNSVINGPDQAVSGYPIASLYLEPQASATVADSKFLGGALLLQIGGTTALSGVLGSRNGGITVHDCDFLGGGEFGFCVFDIDIDLASIPDVLPRILIDGNHFRGYSSVGTSGLNDVLHTAQTGAHYDVLGVVQIYANMTDVLVTNNKISGIACADASGSSIQEFAALVVNNSRGDTLSNTHAVSTVVANNVIYLESNYAELIGMEDKGVSAVNIETPVLNMTGNIVTLYYYAIASGSYAEVLKVYCNDGSGYGDSMIANNLFSIRSNQGNLGTLVDSYIYVQSTSARGSIVNNSFSDGSFTDSSGTSTDVINDSTNSWYVSGNKNQISTLEVTNGNGNYSVHSVTSDARFYPNGTGSIASTIDGDPLGDTEVVFNYAVADAAAARTFIWSIPGTVLPYGVQVTKIELKYRLNNSATTASVLRASIISSAGSDGTSTSINASIEAETRTVNATVTHMNLPENNLRFVIISTINDSGSNSLTISSLNITYRW